MTFGINNQHVIFSPTFYYTKRSKQVGSKCAMNRGLCDFGPNIVLAVFDRTRNKDYVYNTSYWLHLILLALFAQVILKLCFHFD